MRSLFIVPFTIVGFAFQIAAAVAEDMPRADESAASVGSGSIRVLAPDAWMDQLGSGGLEPVSLNELDQGLAESHLAIIDASESPLPSLAGLLDWAQGGGVVLLSGVPAAGNTPAGGQDVSTLSAWLNLAGLRPDYHDPGLSGTYPMITESSPMLAPLLPGDGVRLGASGVGHALRVEAIDAQVLATSAAISARDGFAVRADDAPTITLRRVGDGLVLWTSFSLSRIAACYPDEQNKPTDCSVVTTAEFLMRLLVANLLWEQYGVQLPLPWQTPGNSPTSVLITGDVHFDEMNVQVKAALEMARIAATLDIPVTYFVVGEVATRAPELYAQLAAMPNVEIGSHSASGQQYRLGRSSFSGRRRGGVHGPEAVCEDVKKAEAMLGLPSWPGERSWLAAIRTEAWASNETESGAWSGMACAGIGLVLDQNADMITKHPAITGPAKWFEQPVRQRLFFPSFTTSANTANDNFHLPDAMAERIVSLPSPEPDPCCNDAVEFARYTDYVLDWTDNLLRMGKAGGTTQVWLWHPSTPATRQGFPAIEQVMTRMAKDPDIAFVHGSELATWHFNRTQGSPIVGRDEHGRLRSLDWRLNEGGTLLPLPAGGSEATRTITYWVIGEAKVPDWQHRQVRDGAGRTITILSRDIHTD